MDFVQNLYCALVFIVLNTITYYDLKERRIPNSLLVIMLLLKIGYLFSAFFLINSFFVEELFNSIFGFLFFVIISLVMYPFLNKTIGAADFKLLIVIGFVLGFYDAVSLSAVSLVVSLVFLLLNLLFKKSRVKKLPFAPIALLSFSCLYLIKIVL